MPEHILCTLASIPPGGAKGMSIPGPRGARAIFIVRWGDAVFAYENSCPHMGVTLDWQNDKFLSFDGTYIQCSMHGAQFNIDNGYCVYGPCKGRSLMRVDVEVRGGSVVLMSSPPGSECK